MRFGNPPRMDSARRFGGKRRPSTNMRPQCSPGGLLGTMELPPPRFGRMERLAQVGAAPALDGAQVLVVEDDFLIAVELNSILASAGAEVVGPCRTVSQACDLIDRKNISAAILDFRLGYETSLPLARQLAGRRIPFAFFTAQTNAAAIHAEWPDARIIAKPFQTRTILAAMGDMLMASKGKR